MSSTLFGFYSLGLRAINTARLGLQVTGDNIANVSTPGYSKRRLEVETGFPVRVQGGFLDSGVAIATINRFSDRFIQAGLERETGGKSAADERLRGLQDVQSIFGDLQDDGLLSTYADFSNRFAELAGQPENLSLRSSAVAAADTLARQIRDTYQRLQTQRRFENDNVRAVVDEVNSLSESLAKLNRDIVGSEADGSTNAPLRDARTRVIERLSELTGGVAAPGEKGKLLFSLPGGPTLVSGESALPFQLKPDGTGTYAVLNNNGSDLTSRLSGGKLGALLQQRDVELSGRLADLDNVASDLITRANALTTGASDLDGNPGGALFEPDPAPGSGAAGAIAVSSAVLGNSRLLAISASGAPGDGSVAEQLSALRETASAALGNRSPVGFLGDMLADLGNRTVQADVDSNVSTRLVENLQARRDAVSGVNLDEEAIELVRYQQSFEAAARFLQVLNDVTELSMTLGQGQ